MPRKQNKAKSVRSSRKAESKPKRKKSKKNQVAKFRAFITARNPDSKDGRRR